MSSVSVDLDTLARTVWGEARGEGIPGQTAVAWVIRNRAARGGRFGATVAEVCRRPMQFSCWNSDDPNYPGLLAANVDQASFLTAFGVACLVLSGAIPDPTGGADHYFAVSMKTSPGWAASMFPTVKIGAHQFLREKEKQ